MGQQQTMTVAAADEKGGGTWLLRRMILVLAVAALMAAMLAVSAGSALAASDKANTVGQTASGFNKFGHERGDNGLGGKLIAWEAPVGDAASTGR